MGHCQVPVPLPTRAAWPGRMQEDSRDDTQVTKMLPGLSKRESWNFSPAGISLFLSHSQQRWFKESAPAGTGLTYFTLSDLTLQSDSQGMGKASRHSPASPGSSWHSFNYSPSPAMSEGPAGCNSQLFPCPHKVCSPSMDKSLDSPQVPWGWGSLHKGAGLAFGNQLRLFWLPLCLESFPKSQLRSAGRDKLQRDLQCEPAGPALHIPVPKQHPK